MGLHKLTKEWIKANQGDFEEGFEGYAKIQEKYFKKEKEVFTLTEYSQKTELGKTELLYKKELQKHTKSEEEKRDKKRKENKTKKLLKSFQINGEIPNLKELKKVLSNYKEKYKKIPDKLEMTKEAKEILNKIEFLSRDHYTSVLNIVTNPNNIVLKFDTYPELGGEWGLSSNIGLVEFTPDSVAGALNALQAIITYNDVSTLIDFWDICMNDAGFDHNEKAELLREYLKIVIQINDEGKLSSDIEHEIDYMNLVEIPTNKTSTYSKALAFDSGRNDTKATIESIIDYVFENCIDWIYMRYYTASEWFTALHFEDRCIPDFDFFEDEFGDFGGPILLYYSYCMLNNATITGLKRVAEISNAADNIAQNFLNSTWSGGEPPWGTGLSDAEIIGAWCNEFLKAKLAIYLIQGNVSDEDLNAFELLLNSCNYASFSTIDIDISKIIDSICFHDIRLKNDVQEVLVNFLVTIEGSDLVNSFANINSNTIKVIFEKISKEEYCGKLLKRFLACSNYNDVLLYPSISDVSERKELARKARIILEVAIDMIDEASRWNDDDIIMSAFEGRGSNTLMWATKSSLEKSIKILDEGITTGSEHELIREMSEAIGRIKANQGSGSF